MCMKYINGNIQCFKEMTKDIYGNIGFSSILDSVQSEQKEEKVVIGGFNIVTFINIRGTKSQKNSDNPIDMKKKAEFSN